MLTDEQIIKFQEIFSNRFHRQLNREEAYEKGTALVQLLKLIYKPMTKNEYQKLQEHRREIDNL